MHNVHTLADLAPLRDEGRLSETARIVLGKKISKIAGQVKTVSAQTEVIYEQTQQLLSQGEKMNQTLQVMNQETQGITRNISQIKSKTQGLLKIFSIIAAIFLFLGLFFLLIKS